MDNFKIFSIWEMWKGGQRSWMDLVKTYLTPVTHDLQEEVEKLKEGVDTEKTCLPSPAPGVRRLQLPPPIAQSE